MPTGLVTIYLSNTASKTADFVFILPANRCQSSGPATEQLETVQKSLVQGLLSGASVCCHRLLKCELSLSHPVIDLDLRIKQLQLKSLLCFGRKLLSVFCSGILSYFTIKQHGSSASELKSDPWTQR